MNDLVQSFTLFLLSKDCQKEEDKGKVILMELIIEDEVKKDSSSITSENSHELETIHKLLMSHGLVLNKSDIFQSFHKSSTGQINPRREEKVFLVTVPVPTPKKKVSFFRVSLSTFAGGLIGGLMGFLASTKVALFTEGLRKLLFFRSN